MARGVRLVIVCEDILHETFARAFLKRRGLHPREMHFRRSAEGDAKQNVIRILVTELQAFRRHPGERRGLMYMIDADNLTVEQRRRTVEKKCQESGEVFPHNEKSVFAIIPKWEIENWIAYLKSLTEETAQAINEDSNEYPKYRHCESEIYPYVEHLADVCNTGALPTPPPSLQTACAEYPRLRAWLKSE
jgi:hypothetical protein